MNLDITVLEEIANVGSRNAKIELLKKLEDGKELLAIALDPGVTFGVTADEDEFVHRASYDAAGRERIKQSLFWDHVYETLGRLASRDLTGNFAVESINYLANDAPTPEHALWLARLINKDLRCGVQLSSLLKVWPKLVEPFAVQLALQYDPVKHSLDGEWYLEPKLDGLRMVVIDGVAYSRSGRVISSVDHITNALKRLGLSKNFVWDGEVMGGGAFDEASGKVRRKFVDALDAVYHVFDVIPAADWARKMTMSLCDRKGLMSDLHQSVLESKGGYWPDSIQFVETAVICNPTNTQLLYARDTYIKQGYEGVMLKNAEMPYQFKRGKHLLKFKDFASEDCEVVDMVEGKGKYKGMLGALLVKMPSSVTCEVGTGFNDEERARLWRDFEKHIGAVVEVQHQEPVTAEGRMRFPSFMRFRADKE